MRDETWWYVARAGGIMTWAIAALSIVWGLALSTRTFRALPEKALGGRVTASWLLDVHRYLSALSVVFVAIHLLGLWADSFVEYGPAELFVPMASQWRPEAVAWGVVAFYLLIAVELTSLGRGRLPDRFWRRVHLSSAGVLVLGTIHGLRAGADVDNPLIFWPAVLLLGVIGSLLVVRVVGADDEDDGFEDAGRDDEDPERVLPDVLAMAAERLRSLPDVTTAVRREPAPAPRTVFGPIGERIEPAQHPKAPELPQRTPLPTRLVQSPPPTLDPRPLEAPRVPSLAGGPPPPPQNAVDPATGQPDQRVYREWLQEWLAYVDAYGEQ